MPSIIAFLKRLLFPVAILSFGLSSAAVASTLSWQKTVLDSNGDVGRFCDIAIDSLGDLHVVYLRNDNSTLKEISTIGGAWQPSYEVDPSGTVAGHCGIAVEPNGTGRISYRRSDTGALWYAGPQSTPDWTQSTIDESGDVGTYCDLDVDSLGDLHSVYMENGAGNLKTISSLGGSWQAPDVVDPSGTVAGHCGIAVEPNGTGRISYRRSDTGALWYAGPQSTPDWSAKTIYATASDAGRYVSLVLAPDGRLGSAFYAYDDLSLGDLRMVVIEGDSVGAIRSITNSIATSPTAAVHLDLAITNAGGWYVAYRNDVETALYCASADSVATGIGDEDDGDGHTSTLLPVFALHQNVPNPFNPQTTIAYSIPEDGRVNLAVYDVTGRLVRTLVNETKEAGAHKAMWDARDDRGVQVASGIYFMRLTFGTRVKTRKIAVLK